MRLLLDSHALFWTLTDNPRLSTRARSAILDDANDIHYSAVSLYELVFKAARRRMSAAALVLPESVAAAGLRELGIVSGHLTHAARLDWVHGDPWDRILLAQATLESMALVSADPVFDAVSEARLW